MNRSTRIDPVIRDGKRRIIMRTDAKMGIPTRFAFWPLPRASTFYDVFSSIVWWSIVLGTLYLAIFIMRLHAIALLLVAGGSVGFATLIPILFIVIASWCGVRAGDYERENQA